jgi:hypothetical protein
VSCGTLSVKSSKAHPLGRLADSGRALIPSVIQIRSLARSSGWFQRASGSIRPEHLLIALLSAIAFGERSGRAIALQLGICCDVSASRQAVWKRLKVPGVVCFMEAVIARVMQSSIEDPFLLQLRDSILARTGSLVQRVLLADASTFTMHPSLSSVFPGSKNGKPVPKAHLKLQLVMDLLTGRWIQFSIDPYGRSDMKAAMDFMPLLRAGDLLIRDLGYACMASFEAIIAAEAFFISRLKARVHVLDEAGERIPLRKTLRRLAPCAGDIVRLPILMTKSNQVPCILVAQRVPQAVADERRRKIKLKHKEQGFKAPTKRYLDLQDWTILVTNLPEAEVGNAQILQWYLMRWRIELIFKACKSHTPMLKVVGHKTNQYHARALILAWVLAMVILAHRGAFAMVQLRRSEGADPKEEPPLGLESIHLSIFKMTARVFGRLGFEIELAGCGMDLSEYQRRTMIYSWQHNRTELIKCRKSLGEILDSALLLDA